MQNELYHYGIRGMKWGVRRYQNTDGTLTSAGKKKARQEYRADNKQAFELGKNATITGRATSRSMKRTIKLESKLDKQYEKDPEGVKRRTKSLNKKWQASSETTAQLSAAYKKNKALAEEHCKSLIDKYGDEAVTSIKYKEVTLPNGKHSPDKFTRIDERTNSLSDYARTGAATLASIGVSTLLGSPITMVFSPRTTYEKARDLELATYITNLNNKRSVKNTSTSVDARSNSDTTERVVKLENYKNGTVTNLNKALKSKTPYYALSDKERQSIDRSYQDRRANLLKQRDNASSAEQRAKIVDQLDELELDYLEIVERDW